MACGRCHGFMVVDHFIDMQDDSGHLWLRGWRCVNCGDVVEPGILKHRLGWRSLFAQLLDRCRARRKHLEVIPLGV